MSALGDGSRVMRILPALGKYSEASHLAQVRREKTTLSRAHLGTYGTSCPLALAQREGLEKIVSTWLACPMMPSWMQHCLLSGHWKRLCALIICNSGDQQTTARFWQVSLSIRHS